jgi:hypothetical protein
LYIILKKHKKKCKHMKQNFLFSELMEHGGGNTQAGAWRVSVVCEQELVVFSPVFESWFLQLPFREAATAAAGFED